ncbi:MAG: gliding motility protein GldN [Flavobacteriaceae bacterium]|nr:gliding motility protein GldN [Flavobacteriaceae bacterium]MDZ4147471.1 gliding motility protein GldN [Flavobacteriaceae bacterium]
MNVLKKSICYVVLLLSGNALFAQAHLLNAYTPEEAQMMQELDNMEDYKPLDFGYIDNRDVLWSKTVWEIIDLDERVNFPYYFPVDSVNMDPTRKSLFNVLLDGIKEGNIADVYVDSYFKERLSYSDILKTLTTIDTTDLGKEQINAGEALSAEYIDKKEITSYNIEEYHVKGIWYFDKRLGELKYRMLGIAPVSADVNFLNDDSETALVELFWVWYPSARETLHQAKVFNGENTASPFDFDRLLISRRFNGIIFREDNMYGNRNVKDYVTDNALMQLLESDRIKESVRNIEMDMWNY